jgi:predicted dienelactone hydrolase
MKSTVFLSPVLLFSFVLGCASGETTVDAGADSGPDAGSDAGMVARPDKPGPFGVGFRTYELVDATRGNRPLPTVVYYPSKTGSVTTPEKDAAQDFSAAPYPVVMFSHGSGGSKDQYLYFYTHLASHGFVTAAMDHTGNVGIGQEQPIYLDMSIKRPFDVIFVLDRMAEMFKPGGDLPGLGDAGNAGIAGHSYGGNTTLGLAGTTFGWDFITESCKNPKFDKYVCPIPENKNLLETKLPEKRFKAAITMAHDGAQSYFGPECAGGSSLSLPALFFGGTADNTCPYATEAVPCFGKTPAPKFMVKMTGAGHIGFTDVLNEGDMDLARMHSLIQRYSVAFFSSVLKGDPGYTAYLGDDWTATWNKGKNDFELFRK